MTTTLDRLFQSEQLEQIQSQREEAAAAIEALERKRDDEVPAAVEADKLAAEEVKTAVKALNIAQQNSIQAKRRLREVSLRCTHECDKHLAVLKRTADPAIAELLNELTSAASKHPTPARIQAAQELREEIWKEPLTAIDLAARLDHIREICELEAK